jgi:hypothetical protein
MRPEQARKTTSNQNELLFGWAFHKSDSGAAEALGRNIARATTQLFSSTVQLFGQLI